MPADDPGLARLEPLVGAWRARGATRDSVRGPGGPVTGTETFSWLEGGHFLVDVYETAFGGEAPERGVNYWWYDAEARRFRIALFGNRAPFGGHGTRYEGEVGDGCLTFEGPERFRLPLDESGRIATDADGAISIAWWLRDQGGDWRPWMDYELARAPDRSE